MSFESSNNLHLIGDRIKTFTVRGEETDIGGNWVGADLDFRLSLVRGLYLARIITSAAFSVESDLDELDRLEGLQIKLPDTVEVRPPFVIDDSAISEEVLVRHFSGREVDANLAGSLFLIGE